MNTLARSGRGLSVIGALAVALAQPALAHQAESPDVDTLTRRAEVIVEGKVTDVRSSWNANHTQIHTSVTLRVDEYHKGDTGQGTFTVRYLGGTIGDQTFAVLGHAPIFGIDESVVLFLAPRYAEGEFPFVLGDHGKFTVSRDPVSGAEMLQSMDHVVNRAAVVGEIRQILSAAGGSQ